MASRPTHSGSPFKLVIYIALPLAFIALWLWSVHHGLMLGRLREQTSSEPSSNPGQNIRTHNFHEWEISCGDGSITFSWHRLDAPEFADGPAEAPSVEVNWYCKQTAPDEAYGSAKKPPQIYPIAFGTDNWGSTILLPLKTVNRFYMLAIRDWLLALLALLNLFLYWRKIRRKKRLADAGLCPKCAYDLRAHKAGDKCPECGAIVPSQPLPTPAST